MHNPQPHDIKAARQWRGRALFEARRKQRDAHIAILRRLMDKHWGGDGITARTALLEAVREIERAENDS